MKTERLNLAIFCVSGLVCLLQTVGYLSPAWFVQEVKAFHNRKGYNVDGRQFKLPIPEMTTTTFDDSGMLGDEGRNAGRNKRDKMPQVNSMADESNKMDADNSKSSTKAIPEPFGKDSVTVDPTVVPNSTPTTRIGVRPTKTRPSKSVMTINPRPSRTVMTINPRPSRSVMTIIPRPSKSVMTIIPRPSMPAMTIIPRPTHPNRGSGGSAVSPDITDKTDDNMNTKPILPNKKPDPPGDVSQENEETQRSSEKLRIKPTHIYISAGMWYGRVCVNSHQFDDVAPMTSPGMEWCSVYVRTNGSTLDNIKNMFELRIEASVGLGFSILSFLVACLCCCCHRHHSTRMIISLGSMFVSGAVMAVPVVHTIVRHVSNHDAIIRRRDWMNVFVNTHKTHDLFDHWSVILCAVACIISILSVIVFVIIACKSDREPSNLYKLNHHVTKEAKMIDKENELPENWICNNKEIGTPYVTIADEIEDNATDSTKIQNTELPENICSTFVRDGGESITSGDFTGEINKAFDVDEVDDSDDEAEGVVADQHSVTECGY